MGKSEKGKIAKRVEEVLKLLVVGAGNADIKRYADQHGWKVSSRQVQRYVGEAHKRFANLAIVDRRALFGRHVAMRNALYAKAVKDGDLRTALLVAKDEAKLQGIYPTAKDLDKEESLISDKLRRYLAAKTPSMLSRRTRTIRLLNARARGDTIEESRLKESTPKELYTIPDTSMPEQMLNIIAMAHVIEQLEYAGMVTNALYMLTRDDQDLDFCTIVLISYSYLFRIGRDGWDLFCQQIGIDGQFLVTENYRGNYLEMVGDNIVAIAANEDQVNEVLFEQQGRAESLKTAKDVAAGWREMFEGMVKEE